MRLILRWIVNAIALAVTIYILNRLGLAKWTGGRGVAGGVTALLAVLIMAIVNALIRPNDTATTEIYTLSLQTSSDLGGRRIIRVCRRSLAGGPDRRAHLRRGR